MIIRYEKDPIKQDLDAPTLFGLYPHYWSEAEEREWESLCRRKSLYETAKADMKKRIYMTKVEMEQAEIERTLKPNKRYKETGKNTSIHGLTSFFSNAAGQW